MTAEEKAAILREHLLEKVPVSQLCDKHRISPVNFYNWQRQLVENGAAALERTANSENERRRRDAQADKITQLESKIEKKNAVIAELLEEHVQLNASYPVPKG
ncbi:MAG: transposase [Planctomycetes bacterium]|nr:transposase [Planctomycetota bacterium]